MRQYLDLMQQILARGRSKGDRTGTGTISLFGTQMRFDLREGFPLVTTKKIHLKSVIHELLWFLSGDSNVKYLNDNGVTIWDEWADSQGNLGRVYGVQWRDWLSNDFATIPGVARVKSTDQIKVLVDRLKSNPDCRRLIVTAWNPGELDQMRLPPCHCLFQFWTSEMTLDERIQALEKRGHFLAGSKDVDFRGKVLDDFGIPGRYISCQLYQRSADVFLGVPFNIASYALLLMMVAQQVGMEPYEFIWTGGDTHLYLNHTDQARLQLSRIPGQLPKMLILPADDILSYKYDHFTLSGYEPQPAIKAEVSV